MSASQGDKALRDALTRSFAIYAIEDEDDVYLSTGGKVIARWGQHSPEGIALLRLDAEIRAALSPSPDTTASGGGELAELRAKLEGWNSWAEGLSPAELSNGMNNLKARAEAAEARLAAASPDAQGMVLVPREPNEAMIEAHFAAHARAPTVFAEVRDIWQAMLDAAITSTAEQTETDQRATGGGK